MSKINFFESPFSKDTSNKITIDDFFQGVKSGRWENIALSIKNAKNEKEKQFAKKKVPCVTISGTFENKRAKDALKEHSGFICIDIDHCQEDIEQIKSTLKHSEYTHAVFKSISGKGLAWVVKIDPLEHLRSFESLSSLCFELTGYPSDPACKDVSRLRFVSFDSEIFINENSKVFKKYLKKESKKEFAIRKNYPDLDRFDVVLNKINTDITGDYQQWLKIGFAIASKYGESGEDYFQRLSSFGAKYDQKKTSKQYLYCCRNFQGSGIKIGTFYFYAKQYGFEAYDEREKAIIKEAVQTKKAHVGKESAEKILTDFKDIELSESDKELLTHAFDNAETFENTLEQEKKSKGLNIDEVEAFIKASWDIKRNVLTNFLEIDNVRSRPEDINSIFIACKKAFSELSESIFKTLIHSKFTPTYNPVSDYLNHLKWDKVDRIGQLTKSLNSCTGDFNYQNRLLTRWLLGFVQNVYSDDACPLMLIITGKKNTGKTYFFKYLLPKRLKEYFATSQHDREKDDDLLMTQKLLILDDEFSGKSKQDAKKMKRLLSSSYFDLRPPYGSENIQLKRIAVLAGTCNELEVLNDPTGNRRFIVFEVQEKMNWSLFNSIDKDQLFAQLKELWDRSMTGDLTSQEIEEMELTTTSKHSEVSIEEELILKYYHLPSIGGGLESYTNTEIKVYLEKSTNQKISSRKLGLELKKLGYEQKSIRNQDTILKKYLIAKNLMYNKGVQE